MAMQEPDRTNVFPCKHCSVVYFDMPSLIEHTESHLQQEEDRRFKCDKCGRGYRHAGSLANHKKTHDVGCFQCQICGKENSNALALKSHLRSHTSQKKYTCVDCGKAFRLATQLATHEKVHFSKRSHRQQPLQRSSVDYSASTNEIEKDDSPHRDEQSSSAGISTGSSPVEEEEEEEEMAEGDGENEATDDAVNRPYKCDLCDKAYIHYRSLTNHKKTHQVGMFECTVCFKLFNNMAALYSHQRTHRNRRGAESASRDVMYTGTTPPHQFSPQSQEAQVNFCHLCQVLFSSDDEFQEHIQMHNSSVPYGLNQDSNNLSISYNNSVNSPESTFYASPVNNIPSVSSSVENHGDFEQPREHAINNSRHAYSPRSSNQTATSMNTRGALSALNPVNEAEEGASATESSGDRRFKCQICGKSYRHSGSLINHKRCHQVGIYQCSICRKSYPHLAALRSHLRLHRVQPSSFSLASEGGDWLSSEPLTLDSQLGCFSPQEDEQQQQEEGEEDDDDDDDDDEEEENENIMLGLDQEPTAHGAAYHAVFDQDFPQNGGEHLPHGGQPTQRHMCADCGETFANIAGIKSHCCPLLLVHHQQQQQGAIPVANGYGGSTTTYHQGSNRLGAVPDPGVESDFHGLRGTGGGHDQSFFSEPDFHAGDVSDERLNGYAANAAKVEEEEEDDGDLYQCSVCGNSYTNMAALRTHLRGHTQSHATPASSGPSSMESLRDEVKDDEPGEMMICSACGESFARRQDLLAHQLSHSATAPPSGGGRTRSSSRDRTNGVCGGEGRAVLSSQSVICGACGVFCTGSHHLRNHGCAAGGRDDGLASGEEKAEVNHVVNGAAGRFHADVGAADRQYKCEQCGRSYRHAGSLLNHKKSHKTGVFRCLVCQKRFYNLLALKNHQRSHFDVKRHTCHECGKAFKIQKQLLNHLRRHKENQAKIQELNSQIQALMQMNGSGADGEEQRPRPAAARRRRQPSRRPAASRTPVKSEEAGDPRPFSCDQCGRSYRHAGSLVNHRNSHKTGEYCCSVCSNTYSNQLAMKNHLRTHLAHKKHLCQSCGRGFRGRKQLMTHVCAHLRKDAAGVQRRLKSKAFKCKECKQAFASGEQLAAHGCRGLPGAVSPGKEERPYACNVCDRSYRHAGSLLNHKNTHKTGHFSCSFCSKPFTNPMALRNHTRIHTQKKRYACPTCGKAFRLTSILLNHQKIHSRAANAAAAAHLSCSVCGKRFQGRSGLKRHRCRQEQGSSPRAGVRHADGGEKCFTCDLCGRSYRHAGSLLNHKKTHSESLHHCPLCLQTFPDPLTLQIHSQMKRHCCPECGKTFCLVAHLQGHMEVHSKDRPPPPPTIPLHHHHQGAGVGHRQEPGGPGGSSAGRNLRWDSNRGAGGLEERRRRRSAAPPTPPLSHAEIRPAGVGAKEEEEKGHVCDRCGRTYRHAGSLLNHKNSHKTGSFSCAVCQKEFTNLMALKNHRRIHTEPKRYQCLECGKAFRVSTQLICHRRIHTKEKPFACPLCAKSFSSKSNLRHHQKLHQNALAYGSAFAVDDEDGGSFMDLDMGSFL